MLKNFRFLKPVQEKENDLVVDIDEDLDLDPEFIISEDMNDQIADEIEANEVKYDAIDYDFMRDPDWIKINEEYDYEIIESHVETSEWYEEVKKLTNKKVFEINKNKNDNLYNKLNNVKYRLKSFLTDHEL